MGKKLYVGNLPWSTTEAALTEMFSKAGSVVSSKIVMDRESGRSKGFGFVEMSADAEAADAIAKFNGADLGGRPLRVNEATPPAPRTGGYGSRPAPRDGGGGGYSDSYGDRGGRSDRGERGDRRRRRDYE